jgi:hypothetical protein
MSSNIVRLEPDPHAAVQMLLPWYLAGSLGADERAQVEEHLAGCAPCRAELECERQWCEMQPRPPQQTDVEQDWAKMRSRIAAAGHCAETPRPADAAGQRGAPAGLRGWRADPRRPAAAPGHIPGRAVPPAGSRAWGLPAVLSIALLLAIGWTLRPVPAVAPVYHALAAPATDAATAVVRFRPDATEAQIRAGLNASGARLIDGPTVTDAYVVRLPRERYETALATLRRQQGVALVEALQTATPP